MCVLYVDECICTFYVFLCGATCVDACYRRAANILVYIPLVRSVKTYDSANYEDVRRPAEPRN